MDNKIDYQKLLKYSTPISCPAHDCDSELFITTLKFKKVSAIMSGTGKEEILPVQGPMLCQKCLRPITDQDFGYDKEEPEENNNEERSPE